MGNRAAAIAVESVTGALAGAWEVHDFYARKYGYEIYRILQNGATVSTQNRNRFWALFFRKDVTLTYGLFTMTPKWKTVRQTLDERGPVYGRVPPIVVRDFNALKGRLLESGWFDETGLEALFGKQPPGRVHVGKVHKVIQKKFRPDLHLDEIIAVIRQTPKMWGCKYLDFIDPNGLVGVLQGISWWYIDGANLPEIGFKRLMGFPDDYIFPEGAIRNDIRTYLSKGVIPQVATWVLEQVMANLGAREFKQDETFNIRIAPGGVADFRFTKKTCGEEVPELRESEGEFDVTINELPKETEEGLPVIVADPVIEEVPEPAPEITVRKPAPGPKKRRVAYEALVVFEDPSVRLEEEELLEAFRAKREPVVPPLAKWKIELGRVELTAQYEPPRSGGVKTDVMRILKRGQKKLTVLGYPCNVERRRKCMRATKDKVNQVYLGKGNRRTFTWITREKAKAGNKVSGWEVLEAYRGITLDTEEEKKKRS